MNTTRISPPKSGVSGNIKLTSSKSLSNRALIIRALMDEPMNLDRLADAQDTQTLDQILRGIKEAELAENIPTFDVGPAGTTMRFLTAFCTITPGDRILTGSERMKERPIGELVNALRSLGGYIEYLDKEGYPPIEIIGMPIDGGVVTVDGSVSSQFISALLLIAPMLDGGLGIEFRGEPVSIPYLDMTMGVMRHFGARVKWKDGNIRVDDVPYEPKDFLIEADWSAASYWYEMVALSQDEDAEVRVMGLFKDSLQGDARIVEIFDQLGVSTEFTGGGIMLKKSGHLVGHLEVDLEDMPDMAQTIAVTCAGLGITCRLSGLKTLRIKETDRIIALQKELKKFGVQTTVEGDDILEITDFADPEKEVTIATYHDHRMAMAFAPLALVFGTLTIENPEVVEKSYPAFWRDLEKVGFGVKRSS